MNKILCGDCLELLKDLDDNSVDFVLTDPPYGTNDKYDKVIKRQDGITDFSVISWDKELPLNFMKELYRIMKDDVWGVIFTDNIKITKLWDYIEDCGFKPRNTFYWVKPNKAPTPRSNFKSCVETAVVFTKGVTTKKWRGGGNQDNYICEPFVSGGEKVNHPTQKPMKVFEHLIGLFTDENDVVLDPYIGSGTTAVACKRLKRQYIGMDIDERYVGIANERLRRVVLPDNPERFF